MGSVEAERILGQAFVRQIPQEKSGTIYNQTGSWGTNNWNRETREEQLDHIFMYKGEKGEAQILQIGGNTLISGLELELVFTIPNQRIFERFFRQLLDQFAGHT